ncbi:MAG TPA: hypothetical protein VI112_17970 [Bacteroidia bacterium]|jgi:hypothetical protein
MKKLFLSAVVLLAAKTLFAQHSINGTILSRVGPKLEVKVDSVGAVPGPKDSCDISKDISGSDNPFGIQISSGWVGIGKVMFVSKNGNKYQFRIAKETTTVVINGQKKEQFVPGKKVKVEWK